jgi:hypothetical protein
MHARGMLWHFQFVERIGTAAWTAGAATGAGPSTLTLETDRVNGVF